jgi:hypothetical protein
MVKRKLQPSLPVLAALVVTACQSGPSSAPTPTPTAADIRTCEALTRRILDTPMDNLALIRAAYASPVREKLLRAVISDPYDGGFDYDYVYDTQDERPIATTVGPGRIDGRRIIIPVDMRYTHLQPKQQSWVFVQSGDSWGASDIIYANGRRLTGDLN